MSFLFLLALIAWSIVPYKAWSRGILGGEGFNLGDALLLGIAAVVLLRGRDWWTRVPLAPWLVAVWALVAVSAGRGIVEGEDLREIGRVVRGSGFWIIVPLMALTITTSRRLEQWLWGMACIVAVAAGTLVLFSFVPAWIPAGEEVGVFRGEAFGGFQRVFTLGMWGVYAGSIVCLSAVLLSRRGRWGALCFLLFFLAALSFTFARTFVFGFLIAAGGVLIFGARRVRHLLPGAGVLVAAVVLAALVPTIFRQLGEAVSERAMLFFTEVPEYSLQTFLWRIAEYTALSERMTSGSDYVFGVLGRTYTLPGGYTASMPHISYLGIYFGHGLPGLAVYGVFLAALTIRLLRNAIRARGTDLFWVTVGAFAAWTGLLAAGFSAPVFQYAWGVATLAFVVGASESAHCVLRNENGPTGNLHRDPLSERGTVHPRHH